MNLAIVVPNLTGGGAEKAMLKLAMAMREEGHQVSLILLENRIDYDIDIPVHTLNSGKMSKGFLGKNITAFKLRSLYKKLGGSSCIDLIISTLPFCDEIVHLSKIPNVWFRIANNLSSEIDKLKLRDKSKAARRARRFKELYHGKNVVAVSKGVAEDLQQNLGITPKQVRIIHNIYSEKDICDYSQNAPYDFPYVVHVGRFSKQKRHDVLFRAWSRLDIPHKLVLLTKTCPELDAMIDSFDLADKVVIAGFQKNPYPWINHAEMLVLSSDHEGLPNVLVEALMLNTRVVSTDCPSGPREILNELADQCLAPTGDDKALAERIKSGLETEFRLPNKFKEQFSEKKSLLEYSALAEQT